MNHQTELILERVLTVREVGCTGTSGFRRCPSPSRGLSVSILPMRVDFCISLYIPSIPDILRALFRRPHENLSDRFRRTTPGEDEGTSLSMNFY